jgi:F-type H+-transporting ATPase subunit gamma
MAKGRELKGRIKSVENTRKITRTMEMVATSKMKRAQERVAAARPFATVLTEVISDLYRRIAERFPLLRQPATIQRAAVLVLTSNRGLAGGFNSNIMKKRAVSSRGSHPKASNVELQWWTQGARLLPIRGSRRRELAYGHHDRPTVKEAVSSWMA